MSSRSCGVCVQGNWLLVIHLQTYVLNFVCFHCNDRFFNLFFFFFFFARLLAFHHFFSIPPPIIFPFPLNFASKRTIKIGIMPLGFCLDSHDTTHERVRATSLLKCVWQLARQSHDTKHVNAWEIMRFDIGVKISIEYIFRATMKNEN